MAASTLAHRGVRLIGLGWAGFIAENLILSSNRKAIIDTYGDQRYHAAYSVLSTITTASIAYGYLFHGRGRGPMRKLPTMGSRTAAFVFQTLGLVGISQFFPKVQIPVAYVESKENTRDDAPQLQEKKSSKTFQIRCPFDFQNKVDNSDPTSGLKRVTRHPAFWTMSFLSAGVVFRTQYITEVVMFLGPITTTLVCGYHLDSRHRSGNGGKISPEEEARTSFLPFVALIEGRQSWRSLFDDLKLTNSGLAMALSVLLLLSRRRSLASRRAISSAPAGQVASKPDPFSTLTKK